MSEVMEKTYLLIDELDRSEIIKNITVYKNNIMNNKELRELIEYGNREEDEYLIRDIKKKLYEYDDYRKYMEYYNKLYFIIMDINNKFNKLINVRGCIR